MSDPGPVLGIDLGTTNSVVAVADGSAARVVPDPDGHRLIPSVVSFMPDGTIVVGRNARERRLVDAANTVYSVKRLIGRPFASPEVQRARERVAFGLVPSKTGGVQVEVRKGTYALAEISAMVLRHMRKVAEAELEVECTRAVITVPANFNELQRSATQAAGKVAGLDVLRILNEPTAATLAYGYGRDKPERVAVYDLGGGTFDFTLLELDGDVFEVVGTAGDTFLGGDDVDLIVADRMAAACLEQHRFDPRSDPQCFERLRAAAEWAKCEVSRVSEAELTLEELFVDGRGATVDFAFRMKREELEGAARPVLARSFDVVNDVLREAGRRPREVDSVILVGGSTRMPIVRSMVEEFFGKEPRGDIDPDLVVAQGAAIHGWTLAGAKRDPARKSTAALGRVALRKITVADVKKKKRPSLVEEVTTPRARVPKQPAFAPEHPDDELSRAPVAVISPPVGVGDPLLALDEPSAAVPPQHVETPFAATRKKTLGGRDMPAIEAPAIDAPFADAPLPLPEPAAPAPPQAAPPPPPPPRPRRHDPRAEPPPRPPPPPPARVETPLATAPTMAVGWSAPASVQDLPPLFAEVAPAGPPMAPRMPEVPISNAPPPLLMDVLPLSLGLETAGGYCQHIIPRAAPIPAEKTREFSTARDDQVAVEVRIAQGESGRFDENQLLGTLTLDGLRQAARGAVRIDVTFLINASGVLDVRATDLDTKREQRTRIDLHAGISADEVEQMRQRQEAERFSR